MLLRDLPVPEKWSDLVDPAKVRPLLATALEADRYQLDESRMIALDATTVLGPKLNRYFAVVALLTLGQDRKITTAIRELTPNVVTLTQSFGARKREIERLESDLQKAAMEHFRDVADEHLGNTGQETPSAGRDR
jgi:hypothetical protein